MVFDWAFGIITWLPAKNFHLLFSPSRLRRIAFAIRWDSSISIHFLLQHSSQFDSSIVISSSGDLESDQRRANLLFNGSRSAFSFLFSFECINRVCMIFCGCYLIRGICGARIGYISAGIAAPRISRCSNA